ncbi:MAG: hypothetical protein N3E49_07110 [Bacteroidia bacterium]|nr:hypothetical protein [Bacteroidia bacterium]
MFWNENDEVDIEALCQRFEMEWKKEALGYYGQGELGELFEWYLESENYAAAQIVLEHANYLYPEWIQPQWWRSLLAYRQERYLEAYVQGMKAFEQLPLTSEIYQHLIEVCLAARRLEEAHELLELWWDENPDDRRRSWGAWFLGEALFHQGDLSAAIPVLWRAWGVAIPRQELRIVRLLTGAYIHSGNCAEGIHAFQRKLWIEPTRFSLWLGLARLYLHKLAYAQARQALQEAEPLLAAEEDIPASAHAEYHKLWAIWYESHGDLNGAFREWLRARHYQPTQPYILSKLLEHYQRMGDEVAMRSYVERLYQYGMHRARVRRQIADFHWLEGRYDQATLYYQTLLPHRKERRYAIERILLGALHLRDFRMLRKAITYGSRHFSDQPDVWIQWVRSLFLAGYKMFALRLLEHFLKMRDASVPAAVFYWYAALSVHNKRYEAGLLSLEVALLANPAQVKLFHTLTQGAMLPLSYWKLLHRYGQLSPA